MPSEPPSLTVAAVLLFGLWAVALLALIGAAFLGQQKAARRRLEARAREEKRLCADMEACLRELEKLRMAQHDAKNELLVLQGFLERGETDEARAYLAELLRR